MPMGSILVVLHTMAYLRDTLPLGLKGRFYAMLPFYSKGKILHHSLFYVLNGKILHQTNGVKPNASNQWEDFTPNPTHCTT